MAKRNGINQRISKIQEEQGADLLAKLRAKNVAKLAAEGNLRESYARKFERAGVEFELVEYFAKDLIVVEMDGEEVAKVDRVGMRFQAENCDLTRSTMMYAAYDAVAMALLI